MKKFQFKTDIKCGGCLAKVSPHLDAVPGIDTWEVNMQDPNKLLTVVADSADALQVKKAVNAAGFKAVEV